VYCRVRTSDYQPRCFRCLAIGHVSKDCSGANREKCCRKCGQDGHFAAQCGADQVSTLAFRRVLAEETRKLALREQAKITVEKTSPEQGPSEERRDTPVLVALEPLAP